MNERVSKASRKGKKTAGGDSTTRIKPSTLKGKTGRLKRPKAGRVTQKKRAVKPEQELEPITPFKRGVSIGVKFAAFTAGVVGLFMALQGYLTYSIAEAEMDHQITEQGISMANTLEKSVDRGLWLVPPEDPEAASDPNYVPRFIPRERLLEDWQSRLKDLQKSYDRILQVSILEIPEGAGTQQQALATWPDDQRISMRQSLLREVKGAQGQPVLRIYEGHLQGERVRRFDKRVGLGAEREQAIDRAIEELQRLADQGASEEEQLAPLQALQDLTGEKGARTLDDWLQWRNEHQAAQPRQEWLENGQHPPWVSVFVKASALDVLKAALWKRVGVVTGFGAAAGILLTVLIATLLTGPVRELEQDITQVAEGNLDHQTRVKARDEIGALAHVFNIMTRNLRIAQSNAVERKAFERELNIAKEIQEKLLPERIPQIPGFDIHSHYNAAKEVGGDYYDFIVIDQTHLGIIVADVAGKGIPGAMVMTMARSLVRLASVRNISPADTFKKVNRILAKDIRRGMFVTAAYMVLNVKTRQLKVASAGHNPVVLYRAATGENELLKPAGIALGFDKGTIFDNHIKEVEVQLEAGDRIVTYTDGVNEAMNNDSEEFGDDRFYDLVKAHAEKPSKDFVEAIVAALDEHRGKAEQSDDITITTLKVLGGEQG